MCRLPASVRYRLCDGYTPRCCRSLELERLTGPDAGWNLNLHLPCRALHHEHGARPSVRRARHREERHLLRRSRDGHRHGLGHLNLRWLRGWYCATHLLARGGACESTECIAATVDPSGQAQEPGDHSDGHDEQPRATLGALAVILS